MLFYLLFAWTGTSKSAQSPHDIQSFLWLKIALGTDDRI